MSDLLTAARQALPGVEWTEIGPEVLAYIGQQLVYLTGRGSDGVFVYAGPDSHRWMPTIDATASWLRAPHDPVTGGMAQQGAVADQHVPFSGGGGW